MILLRISHFLIITGSLLGFAFGSSLGVLKLRTFLLLPIDQQLENSSEFVFVSLDRAQKIPGKDRNHYFFSYSGKYNDQEFQALEEVPPMFFHNHSEGKNVEARIFRDNTGIVHSRLRGNRRTLLDTVPGATYRISFLGLLGGGILLLAGSLLYPLALGLGRSGRT